MAGSIAGLGAGSAILAEDTGAVLGAQEVEKAANITVGMSKFGVNLTDKV